MLFLESILRATIPKEEPVYSVGTPDNISKIIISFSLMFNCGGWGDEDRYQAGKIETVPTMFPFLASPVSPMFVGSVES